MIVQTIELTVEQLAARISGMNVPIMGVHLGVLQDFLRERGISASPEEVRDAVLLLQARDQGPEAPPPVERPAGAVRLGWGREPGAALD